MYIVADYTMHMHIAARINSISMCFVNLHPIGLRIYGYTDIYIYIDLPDCRWVVVGG